RGRYPHHAVERDVLIIDATKDRHLSIPHFVDCPSSSERRVAAFTASLTASPNPRSRRTPSPASVVPPGLVTRSRNTAGVSPVCKTISAAPATVRAANSPASSGDMPSATPPAAEASIILYTKAQPDPDKPVTASSSFSGISNATPTAESSEATNFASVFVAWV